MTHAVSMFCQGKVCGPCLRAGLRVQATHKIGEETLGDAPGVIRHGLTQYVCCRCFGLMMGPLAQRLCGVTFPTTPRLQPVFGILGEKLVESGVVASVDPLLLLRLPPDAVHARDTMAIDRERVRRSEREFQTSLANLRARLSLSVEIVSEENADDQNA